MCSSATDTAQCGSPCRKFVVPSKGSTIQRRVGSFAATQVVSWQGSDSEEARMTGDYGRKPLR